jgi:hypothetical protein
MSALSVSTGPLAAGAFFTGEAARKRLGVTSMPRVGASLPASLSGSRVVSRWPPALGAELHPAIRRPQVAQKVEASSTWAWQCGQRVAVMNPEGLSDAST